VEEVEESGRKRHGCYKGQANSTARSATTLAWTNRRSNRYAGNGEKSRVSLEISESSGGIDLTRMTGVINMFESGPVLRKRKINTEVAESGRTEVAESLGGQGRLAKYSANERRL